MSVRVLKKMDIHYRIAVFYKIFMAAYGKYIFG